VSIKELCDRIGVRTGSQPERLGKDHAYLLKSDKLRALGWTDTITLKQGLEEYGERDRPTRELPESQARPVSSGG
jgi:nucleoside-diphosphate-sugar epimerase